MIVRPYGVVIDGSLELGVELVIGAGHIQEIRPHTGIPDDCVVSSAFVNAHSHLEYRGLQGHMEQADYLPWIREITLKKRQQSPAQVREDCLLAARENRATGVALIGEHSDRPFAGEALRAAGISGVVFQEVITFNEPENRAAKLATVKQNAELTRSQFQPVFLSPHAYFTVDRTTLSEMGAAKGPLSIHVAETPMESQFTREGAGPIADLYRSSGMALRPTGVGIVKTLDELGLAHSRAQFIHCCAVTEEEIELMASRGVRVAHCPRSNARLKCPPAPIREMLDAGIKVGLGLDSPASSGPIGMFEEMRAALETSIERRRPLTAEEIWRMATDPSVLPVESPPWGICVGSKAPLIRIHLAGALSTDDLIEGATAAMVEWVEQDNQ